MTDVLITMYVSTINHPIKSIINDDNKIDMNNITDSDNSQEPT